MVLEEYKIAKISAVSALVGAFIGGLASVSAVVAQSWHQEKLEIGKIQVAAITEDRKNYLIKSETLFVELSKIISFFILNPNFDVNEANQIVAEARKAAFSFSVYTSKEMGDKAIKSIEAVASGINAKNSGELTIALEAMEENITILVSSFYTEKNILTQKRNSAFN